MSKKSKHQKGIDTIVNRLINSSIPYCAIANNLEYGQSHSKTLGEMDVFAFYKNNYLIFEFKSHDDKKLRHKAKNQLKRSKKYFNYLGKVRTFYAYWKNKEVVYKQIKNDNK